MEEVWRGIGKVIEEASEVGQVLGKLIAFPDGTHPDGAGNLSRRVTEEIADLYAALDYFVDVNGLDPTWIAQRRAEKLYRFHGWALSGIKQ